MTWSRLFPVLVVAGLVSLFFSVTLALALSDDESVVIRDSDDTNYSDFLSDLATIHIPDADPLAADQVYEGWFVSDDGSRKASTGILAIGADGDINQTFALPSAVTTMTLDLNEENASGQSGTATLTVQGDDTQVVLDISAGTLQSELVHIHVGPCDALGGVVYPLTSFVGGSGTSTTVLTGVGLAGLLKGNLAINSHEAGNPGNYTTCGNIPVPDPSGENLFADFDKFVVTIEPIIDPDPDPSSLVYLIHTIPAEALVGIRELVYSDFDNPVYASGFHAGTAKGTTVGLREQAKVAWDNAKAASDAANDGDLASALMYSEGVVNVIEGTSGANYGDLNGDNSVNTGDGDGLGILIYTFDTVRDAAVATSAASDDATIVDNGQDATDSANNVSLWLGMARDTIINNVVPGVAAGNDIAVQSFLTSVLNQTSWALNGLDADGDGTIARTTGEGGAKQAYWASQDMGTYELAPPAAPPSVGDPAVPQMAMGALILGAALLAIGGFVFFRNRRSVTTA